VRRSDYWMDSAPSAFKRPASGMSGPLVSFDQCHGAEHITRLAIKRPTFGFAPRDQGIHVKLDLFNRMTFGNEVIDSGITAPLKFLEGIVKFIPVGGSRAHLGPSLRRVPREDYSTEKARVAFGKFPQPLLVFVRNRHISLYA